MAVCEGCEREFDGDGPHCGRTCRTRAERDARAAAAEAEAEASEGKPEHKLVRAVRADLERWQQTDSVAGQLALQFARRLTDPSEPGLSQMSRELRSLLAEAREAWQSSKGPEPTAATDDGEPEPEAQRKLTPLEAMEARRREAAAQQAS